MTSEPVRDADTVAAQVWEWFVAQKPLFLRHAAAFGYDDAYDWLMGEARKGFGRKEAADSTRRGQPLGMRVRTAAHSPDDATTEGDAVAGQSTHIDGSGPISEDGA